MTPYGGVGSLPAGKEVPVMRMSAVFSLTNMKVVFLLVGVFFVVLAVMNWLGVLGDWYYLDTGNIAQAQLVYIQMTHWVLVGALGLGLILYGSRDFK